MIAWENLLTGFGFRFRSLLNLAVSSYLLASILQHRGYGESGFSNLASVARSFQLVALGDWIENTYQSLKSGIPEGTLECVFTIWLILICFSLVDDYKDGPPPNFVPNSAIATACIWALWVDFISLGEARNCALGAFIAALGVIAWRIDKFRSREGITASFRAFVGVVVSFVYVLLALPLWFAGENTANHSGDFERGFKAGRSLSAPNRT